MTRKGRTGPGCFVCLDKPAGPTSFALVRQVRRATGYRRVGHGGTLDPFATGLLVVALGHCTRLLRFLGGDKRYRATLRFGISTDTDDATGAEITRRPATFAREDLERALQELTGEVLQRPPRVSAVRIAGERAYALHRLGRLEEPPAARRVRIHGLSLLRFEPPLAELQVDCAGGTYVRSIARDLGEMLGCGAHATQLRRERSGELSVDDAVSLEDFQAQWDRSPGRGPGILPREAAVRSLATLPLAASEVQRVRCGGLSRDLIERALGAPVSAQAAQHPPAWALLDPGGSLVAVAERSGESLRLSVVFPEHEDGDISRAL